MTLKRKSIVKKAIDSFSRAPNNVTLTSFSTLCNTQASTAHQFPFELHDKCSIERFHKCILLMNQMQTGQYKLAGIRYFQILLGAKQIRSLIVVPHWICSFHSMINTCQHISASVWGALRHLSCAWMHKSSAKLTKIDRCKIKYDLECL